MNKTLTKCICGKEIKEFSQKYITDPLNPVFICRECWLADKAKKKAEVRVCCRCGKVLDGKDFIDHRFCLAPNKEGKTGWNLFCISCEPYYSLPAP